MTGRVLPWNQTAHYQFRSPLWFVFLVLFFQWIHPPAVILLPFLHRSFQSGQLVYILIFLGRAELFRKRFRNPQAVRRLNPIHQKICPAFAKGKGMQRMTPPVIPFLPISAVFHGARSIRRMFLPDKFLVPLNNRDHPNKRTETFEKCLRSCRSLAEFEKPAIVRWRCENQILRHPLQEFRQQAISMQHIP